MLFTSWLFVALVSVTALLYYSPLLRRWQVELLVVASLLFYAEFQPYLLVLLLLSLAINVVTSRAVAHGPAAHRRLHAILGVLFNLGVLVFFKYGALLVETLGLARTSPGALIVALPLPLGISFFTFHGITLLIDTFRARQAGQAVPIERGWVAHANRIALYFLFFPQLVAGPITKSRDFLPQIRTKLWREVDVGWCTRQIVLGYFLKIVVADNLAQQTFWIEYPYYIGKASQDLLLMLVGYSFQIFADFAGYSLIALSIAGLFGYRLPENFRSPYLSRSFSEFWTRWHISLSSFLREYLYVPLGGNRKGSWRTYANLMIVMLLGGLWHGAAWSYMVWGGAHGLALAAERFFGDRLRVPAHVAVDVLRVLFVFSFVSLAWLLFKLTDFRHALGFMQAIGDNGAIAPSPDLPWILALDGSPVVAYHVIREWPRAHAFWRREAVQTVACGSMLFLIVTNAGAPQAFVYFQF